MMKLFTKNKNNLLFGIALGILVFPVLTFATAQARVADSDGAVVKPDPTILAYCKKVVQDNIQNAACSAQNISLAKSTASSVCVAAMDGAQGPASPSCINTNANKYIDKAYKTIKPKTAANFTKQLKNVTTEALKAVDDEKAAATAANRNCSVDKCDIVGKYLAPTINVLASLVGVIAILSLIIGGIQYTMAGSDPQKINQAKSRISTTIIALVAFFLLYGMLQFLVPGGIFKK